MASKMPERFWAAMAERFGRRWFDDFGMSPPAAWRAVLESHTREVVADAIKLIDAEKLVHPPSLGMFEGYLREAAKGRATAAAPGPDPSRAYWRSAIVSQLTGDLSLARLAGPGASRWADVPEWMAVSAGVLVEGLVVDLVAMEQAAGRRTADMELFMRRSVAAFVRAKDQLNDR